MQNEKLIGRTRLLWSDHDGTPFNQRRLAPGQPDSELRFEFEEIELPKRRFQVRDNGKGLVTFSFSQDEMIIRLRQAENGHTQLIWIQDETANLYTAETFSDLAKQHPEITEKGLFVLFKRLGITMSK